MAFNIIVRNYEHVNRALPNWDTPNGKYISSKKQYEEELAKGNFVPFKEVPSKESKWVPSADLKKTLYQVKEMGDSKGNIKPTEKLVKKMKKMGISFTPKFMTNDLKGGIDAA